MLYSWRIHIRCRDGSVYNIIYQCGQDCPECVEDEIRYGDTIHVFNDDMLIYVTFKDIVAYTIENVTEAAAKEV